MVPGIRFTSRLVFLAACLLLVQTFAFRSTTTVERWTCRRIRQGDTQSSLYAPSRPSAQLLFAEKSKARVNTGVRTLMDLISNEFSNDAADKSTASWIKTRNYLYRTADALTVTQVQQVLGFLKNNFPRDTCRAVLQNSPRILRKNVKSFLQPTTDFLRGLYGDTIFIQAVERNPDLLLTSGMGYDADALELVELFLVKEVELTPKNIAKLKNTAPFVFQLPVSKILAVLNVLTSLLDSAGYSDEKSKEMLSKLVMSHPHLLQLSVENNLQPRLDYLKERCGLLETDLGVLVKGSSAAVLALSVEENLSPTIDFLLDVLQDRADPVADLRKCLLGHPQLLGLSLRNLHSKKEYFDLIDQCSGAAESKRSDASLASRVLVRSPAVYSLSLLKNIVPTIDFLAGIWGTTTPSVAWEQQGDEQVVAVLDDTCDVRNIKDARQASLASMLSEYPSILTLSLLGNIQPTVNFFNRTGYILLDDNWNLLEPGAGKSHVIRGRYIAASLFNRLLPRWHYYQLLQQQEQPLTNEQEDGAAAAAAAIPTTMMQTRSILPLHVMVSATDTAFCEQMEIDHEAYYTYKTESIPKLKFSSQFDTWLKTGRAIDV